MIQWNDAAEGYYRYLEVERYLSHRSLRSYQIDTSQLVNFLSAYLLVRSPLHVTRGHLSDYLEYLFYERFNSASTMGRKVTTMQSFFGYIQIEHNIPYSPAEDLERPKMGQKLPRALNQQQVGNFFEQFNVQKDIDLRNSLISDVLYNSGCRIGELLRAETHDIDVQEGVFFIRYGKRGKQRYAPISKSLCENISFYLKEIRPLFKPKNDHLFVSNTGNKLYQSTVDVFMKKIGKVVDIPFPMSAHIWRHTFATQMIRGGADLLTIRDILGHSSITSTERYLHVDVEHLREILKKYHPRF